MAFGLSGIPNTFRMLGADPTIAYYDEDGAKAVDYMINSYSLVLTSMKRTSSKLLITYHVLSVLPHLARQNQWCSAH